MSQSILVQREGPVATVVLNRPERLNALDLASWRRLGEVAIELDKQDDLRCIVIRGAGEKAFAAGADISSMLACLRLAPSANPAAARFTRARFNASP